MIADGAREVIPERLNELLLIEHQVCEEAGRLSRSLATDEAAAALLATTASQAEAHIQRLRARLAAYGTHPATSRRQASAHTECQKPSDALRRVFTLLGEATIGYAALAPVANRFRDSAVTAPEGMTGHLARDHSQDYLAAMGRIGGSLQACVLRELTAAGHDCQCTCPACGLGLCVCGIGSRAGFNEAWLAARPVTDNTELTIPAPRATSAAAAAGFKEADRLLSGDGATFTSYPQLQTTIRAREIGERIPFEVNREGRTLNLTAVRADDVAANELPLDCEAPAGAVFYLDRARDLRQRLRRRSAAGEAPRGLGTLSVRETQVLRLVADGATNPMIAAKLRISRATVARHVANILAKLDVSNRSEAAALAAVNGLGND